MAIPKIKLTKADTWRLYGYEPQPNPRYDSPIEKGIAWFAVREYVKAKEKHCCTCPRKNLQGIDAQCGHYRPVAIVGSNNRWSWDERFIHLQCSRDNGAGQGEQVAFRAFLVGLYGEAAVKEFDDNYRQVKKVESWPDIIRHYQQLKAKL